MLQPNFLLFLMKLFSHSSKTKVPKTPSNGTLPLLNTLHMLPVGLKLVSPLPLTLSLPLLTIKHKDRLFIKLSCVCLKDHPTSVIWLTSLPCMLPSQGSKSLKTFVFWCTMIAIRSFHTSKASDLTQPLLLFMMVWFPISPGVPDWLLILTCSCLNLKLNPVFV